MWVSTLRYLMSQELSASHVTETQRWLCKEFRSLESSRNTYVTILPSSSSIKLDGKRLTAGMLVVSEFRCETSSHGCLG
jgi:hypothetical protein